MDIEISGIDEALRAVLSLNIEEELERKALNKAGKRMREAIEEEAPIDKRNPVDGASLHKNIKLRRPKDGEVVIHTGGAYHAHLVEFGRSGGKTVGKNGRSYSWGPTDPNPFFSRGFNQTSQEAKQILVNEIRKGLKL